MNIPTAEIDPTELLPGNLIPWQGGTAEVIAYHPAHRALQLLIDGNADTYHWPPTRKILTYR